MESLLVDLTLMLRCASPCGESHPAHATRTVRVRLAGSRPCLIGHLHIITTLYSTFGAIRRSGIRLSHVTIRHRTLIQLRREPRPT